MRERYRAALDKSAAERKAVEQQLARAVGAIEWLDAYERDVKLASDQVSTIVLTN